MKLLLLQKDWDLFSLGCLEVKLKQRSLCELSTEGVTPSHLHSSQVKIARLSPQQLRVTCIFTLFFSGLKIRNMILQNKEL